MRIFCVFVPNETCLHKNNETGELEEICSLCYYDFTLYQFVWIDSSDGVFFKKDKYIRDKRDFSHPEKDEIALRFLVKSSQYEDELYDVPVVYKRDAASLQSEKEKLK